MKSKILIYPVALLISGLTLFIGCKKKTIPPLTTTPVFTPGAGVTDVEGNNYQTVIIGTQEWMKENLKTTKYNDGTAIPLDTIWNLPTTPVYCWYNDDATTYKSTYGALYNWYTANTGKLCPTGWHVPSDAEWTVLETYLGGSSVAGGKLKETGIIHWTSPNTSATNESGFTALPGGYRDNYGGFGNILGSGVWWSSTEYGIGASSSWDRRIDYVGSYILRDLDNKTFGFSVRCVKD
jgi:uncharacterized protein (TIGR02145 family)